jgi:DNA modification methylase
MTPPRNRIVQGDALEKLCGWPADIAQLCITSPPYWQQREYRNSMGVALPGQWGREPTLETHVAALVELGAAPRAAIQ